MSSEEREGRTFPTSYQETSRKNFFPRRLPKSCNDSLKRKRENDHDSEIPNKRSSNRYEEQRPVAKYSANDRLKKIREKSLKSNEPVKRNGSPFSNSFNFYSATEQKSPSPGKIENVQNFTRHSTSSLHRHNEDVKRREATNNLFSSTEKKLPSPNKNKNVQKLTSPLQRHRNERVKTNELFNSSFPSLEKKSPSPDRNGNLLKSKRHSTSTLQNRLEQIRSRSKLFANNANKPTTNNMNKSSNNHWRNNSNTSENVVVKPLLQENVNRLEMESNSSFSKPLKSNLPDVPVDYKSKCWDYLKKTSNCASSKVPFETEASCSSSSSSLSKRTLASTSISKRSDCCSDDNLNKNMDFQETAPFQLCDNYFPPVEHVNSCFTIRESPVRNDADYRTRKNSGDTDLVMEWAPFDESYILNNIQDLRTRMMPDILPKSAFQKSVQDFAQELAHNNSVLKTLYIVVDTNIFLAHLKLVQQLMELKINGVDTPVILIPWIVIQELDYMKDGRTENEILQKKAQVAIKFINNHLQSGNKHLQGQSVKDAIKQQTPSTNADDSVLNCCLQILERNNRAILLSNDVNLRNKALINKVPAYGHSDILSTLDPFRKSAEEIAREEWKLNKLEEIKINMSHLISLIIVTEMKSAYGSCWSKMALMTKPPWSLEDCLERLLKYWRAVFSHSLQKQAQKAIEEFQKFLLTEQNMTSIDPDSFINHCLSLCIYLTNSYPVFQENIHETVEKIQGIRESF